MESPIKSKKTSVPVKEETAEEDETGTEETGAEETGEEDGETAPCDSDEDCDDGLICNGVEICQGGACVDGEPIQCAGGDKCAGWELCNEIEGGCTFSPGEDCDDGDPCTQDSCDPDMVCWGGVATDCPCVFTPIPDCN